MRARGRIDAAEADRLGATLAGSMVNAALGVSPVLEQGAGAPWIPSPRTEQEVPVIRPVLFTDASGGVWRQSEVDTALVWPFGGGEPRPKTDVVREVGPLLGMVALPDVRAVIASVPLPPPAPLGMIGFEGKRAECTRRTPAGEWCEWRVSTHRLSLAALVELAAAHMREVHGG